MTYLGMRGGYYRAKLFSSYCWMAGGLGLLHLWYNGKYGNKNELYPPENDACCCDAAGEHMTEYELAEYLTTLLGFSPDGGSSELHTLDTAMAADVIDANLPHNINAPLFAKEILGFQMFDENAAVAES